MFITRSQIVILSVTIQALALIGCQASVEKKNPAMSQENNSLQSNQGTETDLTGLVEKFSEDSGEDGQVAWRKLQSYPHDYLITSLLHLQSTLPADDPLRPKIAFVLCNINYEYQANAQVITSALSKTPRYRNFFADQAEVLISRLIHRGDKELLHVLFAVVPWADAALAEGLQDTFTEELRDDTEQFLLKLKAEPVNIRSKVYELIHHAGSLTKEEIIQIRNHLVSIPHDSSISPISNEILASPALK